METVITALIVAGAAFWLIRWFRNTANGKTGCSCSNECDHPETPHSCCGGKKKA